MKEYEAIDFRYDEGFRSRVDKDLQPTLCTMGGGGSFTETYDDGKDCTD